MKKCLGPCVGAVSPQQYAHAVDEALGLLRGESTAVLERAAERRDALGDQWRFEEAAELRDHIRQVEQIVGVQQRLSAFADRNVVLVTPDRQSDRVRLLLIRAGRLLDEVSVPVRATPSHLRHLLVRSFRGEATGHISRDELDDLLILDSWLRNHRDEVVEVAVDVAVPGAAATAVREAMASLQATAVAS
jgi:excinuclease ABC subunit C